MFGDCCLKKIVEVKRTPKTKKIKSVIIEYEDMLGNIYISRLTKNIEKSDFYNFTWKELCNLIELEMKQ